MARVITDTLAQSERKLSVNFAYCRLQGPAPDDAPDDIADWAKTIAGWTQAGRDVFAHFVHEDKPHSPANAITLRQALGIALPGD